MAPKDGGGPGAPCRIVACCDMGMLDPVPLATLGEAMKDAAWLDMRILDHGSVPRVRVQSILVTPTNDIVELYQEYGEDDYRHLEVDSEDIMGAVPSCFERADVPEPCPPTFDQATHYEHRWGKYELKAEAVAIFPYVRTAVFDQFNNAAQMEQDWNTPGSSNPTGLYSFSIYVRYALLLVLYEVTELAQDDVCSTVGYHSIQPLLSARLYIKQEARGEKKDARLTQVVTDAYRDVKLALGGLKAPKRQNSIFP